MAKATDHLVADPGPGVHVVVHPEPLRAGRAVAAAIGAHLIDESAVCESAVAQRLRLPAARTARARLETLEQQTRDIGGDAEVDRLLVERLPVLEELARRRILDDATTDRLHALGRELAVLEFVLETTEHRLHRSFTATLGLPPPATRSAVTITLPALAATVTAEEAAVADARHSLDLLPETESGQDGRAVAAPPSMGDGSEALTQRRIDGEGVSEAPIHAVAVDPGAVEPPSELVSEPEPVSGDDPVDEMGREAESGYSTVEVGRPAEHPHDDRTPAHGGLALSTAQLQVGVPDRPPAALAATEVTEPLPSARDGLIADADAAGTEEEATAALAPPPDAPTGSPTSDASVLMPVGILLIGLFLSLSLLILDLPVAIAGVILLVAIVTALLSRYSIKAEARDAAARSSVAEGLLAPQVDTSTEESDGVETSRSRQPDAEAVPAASEAEPPEAPNAAGHEREPQVADVGRSAIGSETSTGPLARPDADSSDPAAGPSDSSELADQALAHITGRPPTPPDGSPASTPMQPDDDSNDPDESIGVGSGDERSRRSRALEAAEQRLEAARGAWIAVAGPDVDPTEVDRLLVEHMPSLTTTELVAAAPEVKALKTVDDEMRQEWTRTWAELGRAAPPADRTLVDLLLADLRETAPNPREAQEVLTRAAAASRREGLRAALTEVLQGDELDDLRTAAPDDDDLDDGPLVLVAPFEGLGQRRQVALRKQLDELPPDLTVIVVLRATKDFPRLSSDPSSQA